MARPFLPDSVFWLQVAISPFDEACWPWKGRVDANGRGKCRFRRKSEVLAYRAAYELEYGPIPYGFYVLHKCDWPRCCNPKHLFLGTQADNVADMRKKGRGYDLPAMYGEGHARCVVTNGQVTEIIRRYAAGEASQAKLAAEYGIGQTQISRIIRGESRHDAAVRPRAT